MVQPSDMFFLSGLVEMLPITTESSNVTFLVIFFPPNLMGHKPTSAVIPEAHTGHLDI